MIKAQSESKNMDRELEIILGNLLRIGVVVAGSVLIIGAILFLVRHGSEVPSYHIFKPDSISLSNFQDLFRGLVKFQPVPIMELGILLLIATPVLRVLFSVFAFVYEKDYMYVLFTVIVLLVLIFSFFP